MDNFSVIFTKQTVFVFNLLFGVTGLLTLVSGAMIYSDYLRFHTFIGDQSWVAPIFLMSAGGLIFLITVLCCYGTIKENLRIIQIFLVILSWIFFFEIAISVVVYVKRDRFNGTLDNSFASLLDDNQQQQEAWTFIQTELKCCGINGAKDWIDKLNSTELPLTCCDQLETEAKNCTEVNAMKVGCKESLLAYLEKLFIMMAGVGFGISWIQIVVIGYACFMYNAFRTNYHPYTQRLL